MDAKLGTLNYEEKQIIDKTHPPVLAGVKFAADQGTLERGLLIATATGSDEYVPYAPAASDGTQNVKGVLCNTINTVGDVQVGTSIKHGTAVAENLHVSGGALSAADTAALQALTIYPI